MANITGTEKWGNGVGIGHVTLEMREKGRGMERKKNAKQEHGRINVCGGGGGRGVVRARSVA